MYIIHWEQQKSRRKVKNVKVHIELDEHRILVAVQGGNITALRRAGAYIRKSARNRVSQSQKASMPGTPPNTRRGLLKQSLLFGVEKQRPSVVIGPAESFIGTAMTAHEFGGIYRKRRYPKRPLMKPTLEKTLPKLPALWENSVKK